MAEKCFAFDESYKPTDIRNSANPNDNKYKLGSNFGHRKQKNVKVRFILSKVKRKTKSVLALKSQITSFIILLGT